MKRENWKNLMEAVGGVAIVASLVFVGMETRNSTIQAELTTRANALIAEKDAYE
ncbi:MAG: hypothetical protein GWP62_12420 [Gammaproteobacteria bacterium]|nr:hypothetical protein [Gammaproteobacteria bacterium]